MEGRCVRLPDEILDRAVHEISMLALQQKAPFCATMDEIVDRYCEVAEQVRTRLNERRFAPAKMPRRCWVRPGKDIILDGNRKVELY